MSKFTDLLQKPFARRIYLVEVNGYDLAAAQEKTLYLSDAAFTSYPGDTPPDKFYDPRAKVGFSFKRELFGNGMLGGRSIPGYGSLTFTNVDGEYDYLRDWSFFGRRCVIRMGADDFRLSDFGVIFDGTVESVEGDDDVFTVTLRGRQHLLEKPICTTTYLGTGSYEGEAGLTGRRRPVTIGYCRNVEPVYIGLISGLPTYQVSDPALGVILDIPQVYDSGAPLTRVAVTPSPGQYWVNLSTCVFHTGSVPVGAVTANVYGHGPAGFATCDLARYVAINLGAAGTADEASITALRTLTAAQSGVYLRGDETTMAVVCDTLMESIGGWWGYNRLGQFEVGRIDPPGSPEIVFTDKDTLDLRPVKAPPPTWRIILGYERIWRPMSADETVSSISSADKIYFQNEWATVKFESAVVKTAHLNATDTRWDTALVGASAAGTEVQRLGAIHSVPRKLFSATVKTQPFSLNLGRTVRLVDKRHGLKDGKNFVVLAMQENTALSQVELLMWG